MEFPLAKHLPPPSRDNDPNDILERFLAYVAEKNVSLYPAQEEAVLELMAGSNVILNTPTGSGKSLVATALHFKSMAEGRRSYYTCPIKALVSEKFFALCAEFGPENVGMMTGDAVVNSDAPIVCCTAEILANIALRQGEFARVNHVIMDEFHYYSDRDRGTAWQIPLLTLKWATFLLMSATIGNTDTFEKKLTELTGLPTKVVSSTQRPVPLDFEYRETPLHETIIHLSNRGRAPIYIVNFTQRSCAEEAQNLMSLDFCSKEEKKAINVALQGARFDSPYGKEVQKFMRHGIGLHHAGLLPKYRLLVEKLAQQGLLKIICGTDTLGVGVNIPIRTVLFTKLCKYDGEKVGLLSVRDFRQISGRAGRKGFDVAGSVAVQAPEHVVENLRAEQKAAADPTKKKKKFVRKKPPEKGYAHWDRATFERLVTAEPEPLVSRFQVSHGMLLNVLSRPGGCSAMKHLVRDSHETIQAKRQLKKQGILLFRSLVEAGIIEMLPRADGGPVRVNTDLQKDFSLNQTLSLYLLDTLRQLDPEAENYALDVLTLVESILENPEAILMRQTDKLKKEKMLELKAAGVEFDDRIKELDKIEYPRPQAEFLYATFNAFAKEHPWIGQENIRPKSVAREMYELYLSFPEYIKEYEMQRSEGVLLRYLSDTYKALAQTVPETWRTPEIDEIIVFLGAIVRGVDSSLLDEWERAKDPNYFLRPRAEIEAEEQGPPDITRDERSFTVLVRNALFQILRALANYDLEAAQELLADSDEPWTKEKLEATMQEYRVEHTRLRTDPQSRAPTNTIIDKEPERGAWRVQQVMCDPDELNDWILAGDVDLDRSKTEGRVVLKISKIGA